MAVISHFSISSWPYPIQPGSLNAHWVQMFSKYQSWPRAAASSSIEYDENGSGILLRRWILGTFPKMSLSPLSEGKSRRLWRLKKRLQLSGCEASTLVSGSLSPCFWLNDCNDKSSAGLFVTCRRIQLRSSGVRLIGLLTRLDLCPTVTAWERIWRKASFSFLQLDNEEESRVLLTQTRFELADIVLQIKAERFYIKKLNSVTWIYCGSSELNLVP